MRKPSILLGAALAAFAASGASAHDFFLMPDSFQVHGSNQLMIRATVGSSFPTPEIAVTADRAERNWVVGAGNPQLHVMGVDEKSLMLHVAGAIPGVLVAAVKSKPRDVEYAEDRIPLILEEYRIAPEAAAAVERLPKPRSWQVTSRRFAKTLLCVEQCAGDVGAQPLDGTLEFVAHGPTREHFQLIAGGRPLGHYPVDLVGPDGKRQHISSDAQGMVHVPASAQGRMMLFAVVLTPPAGAERFILDLTSLTFERSAEKPFTPERG
jgi:hypothetical protein